MNPAAGNRELSEERKNVFRCEDGGEGGGGGGTYRRMKPSWRGSGSFAPSAGLASCFLIGGALKLEGE